MFITNYNVFNLISSKFLKNNAINSRAGGLFISIYNLVDLFDLLFDSNTAL
jgi:hypothetical protein